MRITAHAAQAAIRPHDRPGRFFAVYLSLPSHNETNG